MSLVFSEILKKLRCESNLSQEEMAEDFGVSQATVCRWENGFEPPLDRIVEIAEYFGVSLDILLANNHTPPKWIKDSEERKLYETISRLNKNNKVRLTGIVKALLDTQEELDN